MRRFIFQSVNDMIGPDESGQNNNNEYVLASKNVSSFIQNSRAFQKTFKQKFNGAVSARKRPLKSFFQLPGYTALFASPSKNGGGEFEKEICKEKRRLRKTVQTAQLQNKR